MSACRSCARLIISAAGIPSTTSASAFCAKKHSTVARSRSNEAAPDVFKYVARQTAALAVRASGSIREIRCSPTPLTRIGGGRWGHATNTELQSPNHCLPTAAMLKLNAEIPGLSAMPDEALLQQISQHHQPALNELYGRYGQTLKAVIDSVVHEGAEAEDVLQEIFLQIWKEAHNYSPKAGKPLGWVVTIARRRAIDRLRRRQAYCRARDRYGEQVTRQPQRPRKEAEAPFIMGDLRSFLKKRMRNLPRHQREALELAFFSGLSHRA